MKVFKRIIYLFVFFLISVQSVSGEITQLGGLEKTAGGIGYTIKADSSATSRLPALIGGYINVVISLLGMVFIVLIWIGAFDIIGAGGNDEQVKKGRNRIKNGAIGIMIILAAFFISKLIVFIISGTGYFNSSEGALTSFHGFINYLFG